MVGFLTLDFIYSVLLVLRGRGEMFGSYWVRWFEILRPGQELGGGGGSFFFFFILYGGTKIF